MAQPPPTSIMGSRHFTTAPAILSRPIPPIRRLPIEILSMIFMRLARMDDPSHCEAVESVMSVMQTCRGWRNVALATQALWQRIEITADTVEWLEIALPRSGEMLLDVVLHDSDSVLPDVSYLLAEVAERLRSLEIWDGVGVDAELAELFQDGQEWCCLETLVLENDTEEYAVLELDCFDDVKILPALRDFRIFSFHVPLDCPLFRQLRALRIYEGHTLTASDGTTLPDFVAVLQACENLEEFHLDEYHLIEFASNEPDEQDWVREDIVVVPLPRMRKFHWGWPSYWVCSSPTHSYQLFKRLQFSASVDIDMSFRVDLDPDRVGEGDARRTNFLEMIPADPTCLPILRTATSASLCGPEGRRSKWLDLHCTGEDGQGSLNLSFEGFCVFPKKRTPFPYPRSAQLGDFCTLFAQAPLTSLKIDLRQLPLASLINAFRTFPRLSTLEVGPNSEVECIGRLYSALVAPPSEDYARGSSLPDDGTQVPDVVLPALRTLRLEAVPLPEHALCTLLSCLALRAKRGAPPLSALCVQVEVGGPSYGGNRLVEINDTIIAGLRSVVKEGGVRVEWR